MRGKREGSIYIKSGRVAVKWTVSLSLDGWLAGYVYFFAAEGEFPFFHNGENVVYSAYFVRSEEKGSSEGECKSHKSGYGLGFQLIRFIGNGKNECFCGLCLVSRTFFSHSSSRRLVFRMFIFFLQRAIFFEISGEKHLLPVAKHYFFAFFDDR